MPRPCICQPSGAINPDGEVKIMKWCARCGLLIPRRSTDANCPECKSHSGVAYRLTEVDVIVRPRTVTA